MLNYFKKKQPEIIVLGDAKSGTTAAAELIGKVSGKTVKSDLPFMWNPTNLKIWKGEITFQQVYNQNRREFKHQIIKEPNLTLCANQVFKTLPQCKYVFVIRSPHNQIKSQLSKVGIDGYHSQDIATTINLLPKGWKPMLQVNFDSKQTDDVYEYMALKWNHFFNIFKINFNRVTPFYYDDFLKDKPKYLTQVLQKLQIEPKQKATEWLNHSFQPKGSQLKASEFFSESNFHKIERITSETFDELNAMIKTQY